MDITVTWWLSFLAGVFTPLGAVCVLPLYPGFIAHLAARLTGESSRRTILLLGFLVTAGMIFSMLIAGFIFITLLQRSFSELIQVLSPLAFILLAGISIILIAGIDIGSYIPSNCLPAIQSPRASAFVFGFFFGMLALPCNPGPIIVLFALSMTTIGYLDNLVSFILFGIGMALPLIILTVITASHSRSVVGFLTKNKKSINRGAGVLMLGIAVYYLGFLSGIW
jgi:cytochrome c-type biogenesis protein